MNFNMTIELTPEQVKEAIKEYINRHINDGMTATQVDLDVGLGYEDRPAGSSYPVFKKATIKVKPMGSYQDR